MTHSLKLNVSKGTNAEEMEQDLELECPKLSVEEGVVETALPRS